jgi:hypothetical protein
VQFGGKAASDKAYSHFRHGALLAVVRGPTRAPSEALALRSSRAFTSVFFGWGSCIIRLWPG